MHRAAQYRFFGAITYSVDKRYAGKGDGIVLPCLSAGPGTVDLALTNATGLPWLIRSRPKAKFSEQGTVDIGKAAVLAFYHQFLTGGRYSQSLLIPGGVNSYHFDPDELPGYVELQIDGFAHEAMALVWALEFVLELFYPKAAVAEQLGKAAMLNCIGKVVAVATSPKFDARTAGGLANAFFACADIIEKALGGELLGVVEGIVAALAEGVSLAINGFIAAFRTVTRSDHTRVTIAVDSSVATTSLSAKDLLKAPIPASCRHPAGRLVSGSLPLPSSLHSPSPGFATVLKDKDTRKFLVQPVTADLTQDGTSELAGVLLCSAGGVSWPELILVYITGPKLLGYINLGRVTPAEHSDVISMDANGGDLPSDLEVVRGLLLRHEKAFWDRALERVPSRYAQCHMSTQYARFARDEPRGSESGTDRAGHALTGPDADAGVIRTRPPATPHPAAGCCHSRTLRARATGNEGSRCPALSLAQSNPTNSLLHIRRGRAGSGPWVCLATPLGRGGRPNASVAAGPLDGLARQRAGPHRARQVG